MPTSPAARRSPTFALRLAARGRDRDAGYVLVELLVAMAILAMIAALALPSGSVTRSPSALHARALDVVMLMRGARNEALRSGRSTSVQIDAQARRIRSGRASVRLPRDVAARFEGLRGEGFVFTPDGRATAGRIVLASGRLATAVRVDPATAAIVIEPSS